MILYLKGEKQMNKLIVLIITILMIFLLAGCGGTQLPDGTLPSSHAENDLTITDTPVPTPDEETGDPDESENDIAQLPSIDYRDYGITINEYDVDYGAYSEMALDEFPLDAFIAWCLGSDGAYAAAANQVLFEWFLADPDEILEYIALIGDEIIHDDYAKVWLCRSIAIGAISRNEFEGNVRISLPDYIDNLKAKYPSGEKAELLSIILEQYDLYIQENFR